MKTKFAIAALALALSSSAAFASLEDLASGQVTFNGEVKSASCNVSIDRQGNDAVITLPTIDKSELANGQTVAETPFTIEVYNCDFRRDGYFTATWTKADLADATKGYLENKATDDAASNVYIALVDDTNGDVVIPGTYNHQQDNVLGTNSVDGATFKYKAGYITDDRQAATAGYITSAATYTLSYN